MTEKINLHPSWLKYLKNEFEKDYMKKIKSFLEKEIKA
jgi:uracil DNA glycosylase